MVRGLPPVYTVHPCEGSFSYECALSGEIFRIFKNSSLGCVSPSREYGM